MLTRTYFLVLLLLGLSSCENYVSNDNKTYSDDTKTIYTPKQVPSYKIQDPIISELEKFEERVLKPATIHQFVDESRPIKKSNSIQFNTGEIVTLFPSNENYPTSYPISSRPKLAPPPKIIEATSNWRLNSGKSIQFNDEDGFPISALTGVFLDNDGAIWSCSRWEGVVKYDGYSFIKYDQLSGLKDISVVDMLFDSEGDIWFGMATALAKYDGKHFTTYTGPNEISQIKPTKFTEGSNGNIWVGSEEGLYKIDKRANTITHFTEDQGLLKNSISALHTDKNGDIWLTFNNLGISKLSSSYTGNKATYTFNNYLTESAMHNVQTLCETKKGLLYVGTDQELLVIQLYNQDNKNSLKASAYDFDDMNIRFIFSIVDDKHGNIWIANENNVTKIFSDDSGYPSRWLEIDFEKYNIRNGGTLSLAIDSYNNLWMGHTGLGMGMSKIFIDPIANEYLAGFDFNNDVTAIAEGKNGDIWFTIYNHGLFCLKNFPNGKKEIHQWTYDLGLGGDTHNDMTVDHEGNVWMGYFNNLSRVRYDDEIDKYVLTRYGYNNRYKPNHRLAKLMVDDKGDLWFTDNTTSRNDKILTNIIGGVYKFDGEKTYRYTSDQGLYGPDAYDLCQDNEGNYWFSSQYRGVTKYDPKDGGKWFHFPTGKYIPSVSHIEPNYSKGVTIFGQDSVIIFTPLEHGDDYHVQVIPSDLSVSAPQRTFSLFDHTGTLWMSTEHGVEKLSSNEVPKIDATMIQSITGREGLELNSSSILFKASDSSLWIGGVNRLAANKINELSLDIKQSDKLNMRVFINDKAIDIDQLMNLDYTENYLRFACNIIEPNLPHQISYRHYIEGFESNYSKPYRYKEISYPNLPHGSFNLKIQTKYASKPWSKPFIYPIKISPPWWHSWFAYIFYFLLFLGIIYYIWKSQIDKINQRNIIEKDRIEAENLRNIDKVRAHFFTNLSHEYRTPLTVILGMAEEIKEPNSAKRLILQSGGNLLKLVNQMLDFSKLEAGKLKLDLKREDLIEFLRYIVESFHSLAEHKSITITFISTISELIMDFDEIKIQHIFTNLLSNAIKFTPKGGEITIHITTNEKILVATVHDNGIGISDNDLPHIFDRYFQANSGYNMGEPGTGIGLSFACDLTKLMGGNISVDSELGKGSTFIVELPMLGYVGKPEPILSNTKASISSDKIVADSASTMKIAPHTTATDLRNTNPRLLIIEDNPEVISYLKHVLSTSYHIEIAEDGQIGIDKALELVPDIIISDVMMPFKDGYEVTNHLKNNVATNHIPIVLLTAKADDESRLTGLRQKADAYLSKPFNKVELLLVLKNLVELRTNLQTRYSNATVPKAVVGMQEEARHKIIDEFVLRINAIIDNNMSNSNFLVDELAKEIGLSQSQLHRKLKALTGRTTVSYLRFKRLQKAYEYLEAKKGNISEIAYEVGFNDPSYFTRAFTKEFGRKPKDVRN